MTELFKKAVVPAAVDATWSEKSPFLAHLSPAEMLVVARPYQEASKEEATLANMLKACGFTAATANVLQLEDSESIPWTYISAAAQPRYVLLLGIPPAQLGIQASLPANAATEFGGVTFIWTSTIQHLTATEAARKALWVEVLQPVFKKA